MAVHAFAYRRCRYINRPLLVGVAATTIPTLSSRCSLDGTDCRSFGDHCSNSRALLEVRNEHDSASNANRETQKCEG